MPNTFDYVASAGYMKPGGVMTSVSFSQQQTLGGGDIRRHDMPFVSNRMNSFRAGAMVMYPIPKLAPLAVHFGLAHTFDGRNVGEATTSRPVFSTPSTGARLDEIVALCGLLASAGRVVARSIDHEPGSREH